MRFLQKLWPSVPSAKIDGGVFKLYYRCTVLMLLVFSFVITCKLLFGNSFFCNSMYVEDYYTVIYCYTHGTFVDIASLSKNSSYDMIYPGVLISATQSQQRTYASYYPWVNLFFLVLAILFYLPHLFWKVCEGDLMTRLTSKVKDISISEGERKAAIAEIGKYILATRGGHLMYAGVYVLSEIFNWIIGIISAVWLTNFFNADFYFSSLAFEMKTWDDFFAFNFPLMGMCALKRFGATGGIQHHVAVCDMPLNNLYGYMFLFLYAWFIMLCVLQALVIPYRVFGLILPPIRLLLFRLRSGMTDQTLLNFTNTTFSLGDWFLLLWLQKNLLAHDLVKLLIYMQQNINRSPLDVQMDDLAKQE